MGRRANSKKQQKKRRQQQKQKQKEESKRRQEQHDDPFYEIRKLIQTISDDDVLSFRCDIPSDQAMDELPFPNVEVVAPDHDWLTNNLMAGVDEWGMAWYTVLREDDLVDTSNNDYDNYSRFSEQDKQSYRKRMTDIVRRERRIMMYRKWMIAKQRLEREKVLKGKKKVGREEEKGGPKVTSSSEWNSSWADWDWDDDDSEEDGFENEGEGDGDSEEDEFENEGEGDTGSAEFETRGEGDTGGAAEKEFEVEGKEDMLEANVVGKGDKDEGFVEVDEPAAIGIIPGVFCGFPTYSDGDDILYYAHPFSLAAWYRGHLKEESRWLPEYKTWGGDKMTRELLAIIQSLVIGVLDYLGEFGSHGSLGCMSNYRLTQYVSNHVGAKKPRFKTELLMGSQSAKVEDASSDIQEFIGGLHKLFQGGVLDAELNFMLSLLRQYPYSDPWINLVLRDFPALWDGYERGAFFINFYARYVSDQSSRTLFDTALSFAVNSSCRLPAVQLVGWISKIPAGSIYDHILRMSASGSGSTSGSGSVSGPVMYSERSLFQILKYIRATLHHYRQKPGGARIDFRRIELFLSQFFKNVLLNTFIGMCATMIFLS